MLPKNLQELIKKTIEATKDKKETIGECAVIYFMKKYFVTITNDGFSVNGLYNGVYLVYLTNSYEGPADILYYIDIEDKVYEIEKLLILTDKLYNNASERGFEDHVISAFCRDNDVDLAIFNGKKFSNLEPDEIHDTLVRMIGALKLYLTSYYGFDFIKYTNLKDRSFIIEKSRPGEHEKA